MSGKSTEVIDCGVGRVASEEDQFLVSLGDEQIKRNLPFLNDVLRQQVTLSTALMGGGIAFLKDAMATGFKVGAVFLFLAALIVALVGVLPHPGMIERRAPGIIARSLERALDRKRHIAYAAAGLIVAGLIVALLGLLANLPAPPWQ